MFLEVSLTVKTVSVEIWEKTKKLKRMRKGWLLKISKISQNRWLSTTKFRLRILEFFTVLRAKCTVSNWEKYLNPKNLVIIFIPANTKDSWRTISQIMEFLRIKIEIKDLSLKTERILLWLTSEIAPITSRVGIFFQIRNLTFLIISTSMTMKRKSKECRIWKQEITWH